jgi:transposase
MDRDCFWLNERQFARLEPHLPTDTRGKPRVDDRRVISGIVHVLKSGCRWIDAPDVYGSAQDTLQSLRALGSQGNLGRHLSCVGVGRRPTGGSADCTAADAMLDQMSAADILHGDKGYDSDAVRRKIESKGAALNIPPKTNRRWKNCFSPRLYRNRNAIERMFGRLKDLRRIATRYDRLAHNFLAAVCLAATLCYWL